jgi:hypothetical protein
MLGVASNRLPAPDWALGEPPMPLVREMPAASPFPHEALGDIGAAVVAQMHRVIQAPLALIGQSILAAMNQACQPYANVCIDGRVSPLSEYFLTLGESGERKSAADSWALAGVRQHQRNLMAQYDQDRDSFEKAQEVYETTAKRILADKKLSPEAKQARLDEIEKPQAPVMPLLIVSEPSSEAIQRQLIIGEPSIGLVNDEGGQFLGGFAMSPEKRLGTLTTLSRLWDRGEFDRVRVGDGSGSYFGRRLCLHLMVQPAVAASLLADPLAREQGFLARCLVSYPKSTAGKRTYVEADLNAAPAYQDYACRIQELLTGQWPKANDHELDPPNLFLSPEAKRTWIAIYNDLETGLAPEGAFATVRSLASKAPEHIARLAGTFAVFEGDDAIHEDQVDRALQLMLHYLTEAQRLWGAGQIKPELKLALELLQWLRTKVGPGRVIALADVYRKGPAAIRSAAVARGVMRILMEHGWVIAGTHPKTKEAFELVEPR